MAAVTSLMHHAIRIGKTDEDLKQAEHFYSDILGLEKDEGRPYVPSIPGLWYNIGPNQIHLMGADGPRVLFPEGREGDPTVPHVALMVDDLESMRGKLRSEGIPFWEVRLTGGDQLFIRDPFGNLIELQERRG